MASQVIDKIEVEIDATAKGASAVFQELEQRLAGLQRVLNAIDTSTLDKAAKSARGISAFATGMSKTERDVVKSVDKIQQALAGLQSYKNAALAGDASSQTSFERQVVRIQSAIDVLKEKLKQAGAMKPGLGISPDNLEFYREQVSNLTEALETAKSEVENMPKPTIEPDVKPTEDSVSKLDALAEKVKAIFDKMADGVKRGLSRIHSGFKKIHDALHKMRDAASKAGEMGFGKLLKYGFGIRSLYVLFRRLRKAVIESFGELQNSGAFFETTRANIESLKAALNTLKFQFGAAFEPIFNAVAPALQTLVNYLIYVMNVISAFTAKLMGKSTYSKAVANMGALSKATGGAAKAQKELNKQLQGFDELNNLTTNNPSGGGGGGGGGGKTPGATYIEESVDSVLGDFGKNLAEKIRQGDWRGVGEVINEKLKEIMENIPWDSIFEKARNFGTGLAEFLNGLISPDLFADIGITIANAINTAFEFLNSFGTTFEWDEFGQSIGEGISAWFRTANFGMWGETIHTWVAGILNAGIALINNTDWDEIGTKLAAFLNGLQISDIASKLYTFGITLAKGIANALGMAWHNIGVKERMIAVLGAGILLASPIALKEISLMVGTAVITFEAAKLAFANTAQALGDEDTAETYRGFSWQEFFETIMKPDGSGVDWEAIGQGIIDYFKPLGELIGMGIESLKETMKSRFERIGGWFGLIKDVFLPGEGVFDIFTLIFGSKSSKEWVEEFISELFSGLNELKEKIKKNFEKMGGWKGLLMDIFTPGGVGAAWDLTSLFFDGMPSVKEMFDKLFGKKGGVSGGGGGTASGTYEVSIKTVFEGIFQSVDDYTHFSETWNKLKSSWSNLTSTVKATLGGTLKKITDLDSWRETFTNLKTEWTDKSAELRARVGDQLRNITDLDTWKQKINDLKTNWFGAASTFKAKVGDQLSHYTDLNTWRTAVSNLRAAWADKAATFKATVGGAISRITDLFDWKTDIGQLKDSWVGRTATFVAQFSFPEALNSIKDKVRELKDLFSDRKATFSLDFKTSIDNVRDWINKRVIHPLNDTFRNIPFLTGVKIPTLATGGVVSASTIANIGEAGAEAIVPLENNTGWLKRMSNMMVDGLVEAGRYRFNANPITPSFSSNVTTYNGNADMLAEQNALLAEQNRLLQQIAAKDLSINPRDVYNATYNEARNYYNRTGNSPFVF